MKGVVSTDKDEIYEIELIREKARLDEKERRDREQKLISQKRDDRKYIEKLFMNLSLIAFSIYMIYKAYELFI